MWIRRDEYVRLKDDAISAWNEMLTARGDLREKIGENTRLKIENERLRADLDHLKLRVNAVEKERQMLIMDRIGVKIPVPEFVGVPDLPRELEAVNEMPDMSLIGNDAPDDFDQNKIIGPDYSGLPVRKDN